MNKIRFASAAMAAVLTLSSGAAFIPQAGTAVIAESATVESETAIIKGTYGVVSSFALAMTKTEDPKSPIVCILRRGQRVRVYGSSGNRTLVSYGNKSGFVMTRGLSITNNFR